MPVGPYYGKRPGGFDFRTMQVNAIVDADP
jgi:hypothetical protein